MKRKYLYSLAFAALLLGAASTFVFFMPHSTEDALASYQEAIVAHENAAFFVATEANPVRTELNQVLSQVLDETTPASDRIVLSERGVALLDAAEVQIDRLGDTRDALEGVLSSMEGQGVLLSLEERDLVHLAREEIRIIADIRGLSYRSNYYTKDIFTKLIKEGGELTDAYIIELNEQIPKVEEQFNARSNLYYELEEVRTDIRKYLALKD